MNDHAILFDTAGLRKQRHRAAATLGAHDFLLQAACERLGDRLLDLTHHFPLAADIGCHHGILARHLAGHPRLGTLLSCGDTWSQLAQAPHPKLLCDDGLLPFADNSLDAIFSVGSLHWVNDLPGLLIQAQRALRPDGLFMAILPGANTLMELRESLAYGESLTTGGLSPRIPPFPDIRDAGGLLQRAGFALPVADTEMLSVSYDDMFALAKDLRGMGETSALLSRQKQFTRRDIFAAAGAHYAAQHNDEEGRITASFELLTLTAWKPAPSQQKPLARGSATHSLAQALR